MGSALGTPDLAPDLVEPLASKVEQPRWLRRLAAACVLAAILPIVVATVRAVASDWIAIGDNAFFGLRAADVLTEHHPWLGLWSSASVVTGLDVNHPGPLLFDLLAIPVRIGGPDAGVAVGIGLLNIACVVGIAIVARRQAGLAGVVTAMAAAAALGWALGSELLYEPWQPHSLLFPTLCVLFLLWALACGDVAILPWAVATASLIMQTHGGYLAIVPLLGAAAVAAGGVRLWRSWQAGGDAWPALRRRAGRSVVVALVVGLVAWFQPVAERFAGEGRGNLERIVSSVGDAGATVGVGHAPRYVAELVALPPWWGRPSISESFTPGAALPSRATSLVALAVVGALLVAGWAIARRRGDSSGAWAAASGATLVVVALLATGTMPIGAFANIAAHQVRWLWPVSVFVSFAIVASLLGLLRREARRWLVVGTAALAGAFAALNLPYSNPAVGPAADADAIETVRELRPQLAPLADERGVLIDTTGERFAEPYTFPVMVELERLGVPWFVADPALARQVGTSRAHDGQASSRLYLREGDAAREVPAGAERVAFVEGLSDAEAGELDETQARLRSFIADGGLVLRSGSSTVEVTPAQLRDADYLFASRALVELVTDGALDVPARWAASLDRYVELQRRADFLTVAVFVEPLRTT